MGAWRTGSSTRASTRADYPNIPAWIADLADGNPGPIATRVAAQLIGSGIGALGYGLGVGVSCAEWLPYQQGSVLSEGRRAFPSYPASVLLRPYTSRTHPTSARCGRFPRRPPSSARPHRARSRRCCSMAVSTVSRRRAGNGLRRGPCPIRRSLSLPGSATSWSVRRRARSRSSRPSSPHRSRRTRPASRRSRHRRSRPHRLGTRATGADAAAMSGHQSESSSSRWRSGRLGAPNLMTSTGTRGGVTHLFPRTTN